MHQPRQEGLHDHPPTGVQGDHGAAVQGRAQNRVQEGKDKLREPKNMNLAINSGFLFHLSEKCPNLGPLSVPKV